MDLENELQRVLRDDKLDVPVRTGAEWSLVAGARRRRRHRNTVAAVSGVLTASLMVGGSVAVVGGESLEGVPPAVRPVVTVTSKSVKRQPVEPTPVVPHEPHVHSPGPPVHLEPAPSAQRESSSERPSVLRESETSELPPTTSEPAPTTSPTQTSPEATPSSVVEEQPPG